MIPPTVGFFSNQKGRPKPDYWKEHGTTRKKAARDPNKSNGSPRRFLSTGRLVKLLQKETFGKAFQKRVKQENTAQYLLMKKTKIIFSERKISTQIGKEINSLYSNTYL